MEREIKYILRNSPNFSNAKEYIENLCQTNNINNYEFKTYHNDEIALFINDGNHQYVIYLDYNDADVKVAIYGRILQIFTKDSAWIHAVRFVKEQIINNI